MLLNVITNPNPNLRKKSVDVEAGKISSPEFQQFIKDMAETMLKKDGIGLAAPQVDKQIRLIVINVNDKVVPFINPEITKKSWRKDVMEEGCLSVPGTFGKVKRHTGVDVEFLDLNGQPQKIKAKGMLARVFQHEIDHLNGVLFIDKLEK